MLLWRAAFGRVASGACCLACRLSCMSVLPIGALYDRGRVRCCQGGIFGNMSSDGRTGGIPAYAGMTGGGAGCDGRWGIPAYAGMTGGGVIRREGGWDTTGGGWESGRGPPSRHSANATGDLAGAGVFP